MRYLDQFVSLNVVILLLYIPIREIFIDKKLDPILFLKYIANKIIRPTRFKRLLSNNNENLLFPQFFFSPSSRDTLLIKK